MAAGYFLKIDALGNLHWNTHDALLGLQVRHPAGGFFSPSRVLVLPAQQTSGTSMNAACSQR